MLPLFLDEARFDKMLQELLNHIGSRRQGKLLEIGCGYGAMLIYGIQKYDLDVWGIEPARKDGGRCETAQRLMHLNNLSPRILCGFGERLPFSDQTFDVVYSFQVLEHVQNPFQVLQEAWRVLKPGGMLYINAPNYNTFFEGHYHVFWIPGLTKPLAKVYLRILGKNPQLVDELNFLTPHLLRGWLEAISGQKLSHDFGLDNWRRRLQTAHVHPYTHPRVRKAVEWARKLGVLRGLAWLGSIGKWQDTLRVALVKEES